MFSLRKTVVSLILLACAFVIPSFLSPHAVAASPMGPRYTFLIVQNGKVTHSWSGAQSNRAQQDKDLKSMAEIQHALLASHPTASTSGRTAALAVLPDINQGPCGGGDFLVLTDTDDNEFCFANGGTLTVDLRFITTVFTGNNEANFSWTDGPYQFFVPGDGKQLCKHDQVEAFKFVSPSYFSEVLFISITNPNDPCEFL